MDSNLKASLKTLHARLANAGPLDEESQDLLQQLEGDIKQLLEGREDALDMEQTTSYGLAERAQELSARFAARHPALEPTLRELSLILSNMGI